MGVLCLSLFCYALLCVHFQFSYHLEEAGCFAIIVFQMYCYCKCSVDLPHLKYNKAVIIYKALNNMTPDYITKLLIPMSQAHSLNLRSGQNGTLYTPLAHTSLYSGAFSCSAPKLWNSFPQEVRNSTSLSAFKRNVRTIC